MRTKGRRGVGCIFRGNMVFILVCWVLFCWGWWVGLAEVLCWLRAGFWVENECVKVWSVLAVLLLRKKLRMLGWNDIEWKWGARLVPEEDVRRGLFAQQMHCLPARLGRFVKLRKRQGAMGELVCFFVVKSLATMLGWYLGFLSC